MSAPTLLRSIFPLPRTSTWGQWAGVYLAQGLIAGLIDGTLNYLIGSSTSSGRLFVRRWPG